MAENRLELTAWPNPSRDEAWIHITAGVAGEAVYQLADAAGTILALRITAAPDLQGWVKIIKS
jgi:hypothetical protein